LVLSFGLIMGDVFTLIENRWERGFGLFLCGNSLLVLPIIWLMPDMAGILLVLAGAGLVIPGRRLQRVRRGYEARALFRNLTEMEEGARAKAANRSFVCYALAVALA